MESHIKHVSATSIKTYLACKHRWYSIYVKGYKEAPSPSMEIGTKVHSWLENYLNTGLMDMTDPSIYEIASKAIDHLPTPMTRLATEVDLRALPIKDLPLPFLGYIDVISAVDKDCPEIIDHKTCSTFRNIKTMEELKVDIQMSVYGAHVLNKSKADKVRYTHVYVTTKPPLKSMIVTTEVTREVVEARFRDIINIVNNMIAESAKDPTLIEKNFDACWAYGKPCHVKSLCERVGFSSKMDLSFLDEV